METRSFTSVGNREKGVPTFSIEAYLAERAKDPDEVFAELGITEPETPEE